MSTKSRRSKGTKKEAPLSDAPAGSLVRQRNAGVRRKSRTSRSGPGRSPFAITVPPALTAAQAKFVEEYEAKQASDWPNRPPSFIDVTDAPDPLTIRHDQNVNPRLWWARFGTATGSTRSLAQQSTSRALLRIVGVGSRSPAHELETALAHTLDIGPRDGLEGMLVAQMVAVNIVGMDCLARSVQDGVSAEVAEVSSRRAERLLRLFSAQAEALSRYRGKGPSEQKVTVEHVHVHEGGQAVVGNVTTGSKPVPGGWG